MKKKVSSGNQRRKSKNKELPISQRKDSFIVETKEEKSSLNVNSNVASPLLTRFLSLIFDDTSQHWIILKILLHLFLGFILTLLSESLAHSKTESLILFPTLVSTINLIGIGFIISSIVMIGFTVITPFLAEKLSNVLNLKNSNLSSDQNDDEDSQIFHKYFLEISELNKKMEQEQKEIDQIKSETYQIAYETQQVLSILRSKVGIN